MPRDVKCSVLSELQKGGIFSFEELYKNMEPQDLIELARALHALIHEDKIEETSDLHYRIPPEPISTSDHSLTIISDGKGSLVMRFLDGDKEEINLTQMELFDKDFNKDPRFRFMGAGPIEVWGKIHLKTSFSEGMRIKLENPEHYGRQFDIEVKNLKNLGEVLIKVCRARFKEYDKRTDVDRAETTIDGSFVACTTKGFGYGGRINP